MGTCNFPSSQVTFYWILIRRLLRHESYVCSLRVKKSSVTSVRLLTESGTRDYCSNWPLLVALNLSFVGLLVLYLGVDKELLYM